MWLKYWRWHKKQHYTKTILYLLEYTAFKMMLMLLWHEIDKVRVSTAGKVKVDTTELYFEAL